MDEADHRRFISSGSAWEAMAGYSRAVVDGDWIFVSGTLGQDFSTMRFPASAQAQAEQALDTIEAALQQVPASLTDVVRVRVYVPDRGDVASVSAVIRRRLGAARAANTTVCCALAVQEAKVEIEGEALRPGTWVRIMEVEQGDWGIGGRLLDAAAQCSPGRQQPALSNHFIQRARTHAVRKRAQVVGIRTQQVGGFGRR